MGETSEKSRLLKDSGYQVPVSNAMAWERSRTGTFVCPEQMSTFSQRQHETLFVLSRICLE